MSAGFSAACGPGRSVAVTSEILAALRSHAQVEDDATESGGMLLGCLSEACDLVTLDAITTPGPLDVRTRFGFEHHDPSHAEAIRRAWEETGGRRAYWGEWHTHAEPDPTPSPLDLETWRETAAEAPGGLLFFAIVGTERVGVWVVSPEGVAEVVRVLLGGAP